MQCVACKQDNDRVVDSRSCGNGGSIRRRRECLSCGRRFTTYERSEVQTRMVIKKDGRREPFSREKMIRGIRTACQKRQISADQVVAIVDRVEAGLFGDSDREVSAREVGEKVIEELKGLDKVAYVRFASVYREFTDVGEFVDALLPFLRGEALAKLRGGAPGGGAHGSGAHGSGAHGPSSSGNGAGGDADLLRRAGSKAADRIVDSKIKDSKSWDPRSWDQRSSLLRKEGRNGNHQGGA
jgi:transcriptional repressor NrdR